eukprot:3917063-Rhodomonas_salina.2
MKYWARVLEASFRWPVYAKLEPETRQDLRCAIAWNLHAFSGNFAEFFAVSGQVFAKWERGAIGLEGSAIASVYRVLNFRILPAVPQAIALVQKINPLPVNSVSYTHLRAHETEADL